ncbi:MAG: hypothetical protein ACRDY2_00080 [Acidimicrobiales bacterium]
MPLALVLTRYEHSLWTALVIAGIVLVIAVIGLLSLLIWMVKVIDGRVVKVRNTLAAAAANTANCALIPQTAERVDAVLAEGLEHHLFLGRVLEKVRT